MKGLIGRKLGMTQVFGANGEVVPVTVLEVANSTVLQVKTAERDGYEAIQVGYGSKKIHRATRANRVRAEMAGLDSAPVRIREFRTPDASQFQVGDKIGVDFFEIGDRIKIRGTSKGRGFSGAMKRHGFSGGTRASHGGGPSHRGVGSVGMSATPARTNKGRKLAGQFGNRETTVLNLVVVDVDREKEILLVGGSVPGPVNGLVRIELVGETPRSYVPTDRGDEDADTSREGPEVEEAASEEMEEEVTEDVPAADDAVEEEQVTESDEETESGTEIEPEIETEGNQESPESVEPVEDDEGDKEKSE